MVLYVCFVILRLRYDNSANLIPEKQLSIVIQKKNDKFAYRHTKPADRRTMEYWIIKDGESLGPYTLEELQAQDITPKTKVWFKDLEEWTPAADIPALRFLFEEHTPPLHATPPPFNPHHPASVPGSAPFGQTSQPFISQPGFSPDTTKCPPTYLAFAIITTLCCALPVGIVAIYYASKVSSYYHTGNFPAAQRASNRAMYWSIASLITWLVTFPITLTLSLFS